jgi:hypothetical protein
MYDGLVFSPLKAGRLKFVQKKKKRPSSPFRRKWRLHAHRRTPPQPWSESDTITRGEANPIITRQRTTLAAGHRGRPARKRLTVATDPPPPANPLFDSHRIQSRPWLVPHSWPPKVVQNTSLSLRLSTSKESGKTRTDLERSSSRSARVKHAKLS